MLRGGILWFHRLDPLGLEALPSKAKVNQPRSAWDHGMQVLEKGPVLPGGAIGDIV